MIAFFVPSTIKVSYKEINYTSLKLIKHYLFGFFLEKNMYFIFYVVCIFNYLFWGPFKIINMGQGCSWVGECLSGMHEALGEIAS